jgi:Flp pilus assembly protein TadG
MKKALRSQRGQGLVEFAVIFPFMVFFLFAIFDVGLAFNRQATIQHAAREGARYAALSDDETLIRERTATQSQGLLDADDFAAIQIEYFDMDCNGEIGLGDRVDVTVNYEHDPFALDTIFNFWGTGIDTFNIEVTGSSRIEKSFEDPPFGDCP